ncbi:MAG: protein-disulfide reductase DsbD domain-containing protein [Bacteroidota bacterium]
MFVRYMKPLYGFLVLSLIGSLIPISTLRGQEDQHTLARLVADVESVEPGADFTLGVRLNMDPGWHTYWKNPGEAGLATRIDWELPEGFRAGEIMWPLPEKLIESGDVLTYGYGNETMLLVPFSAPSSSQAGTEVTFRAEVSWLECEAICVPGAANLELTLPVRDGPAVQDNEALFEKYRVQLPLALSDAGDITLQVETRGGTIQLRVELSSPTDGEIDFYPDPHNEILVGRTRVTPHPSGATVTVPLSAYQRMEGPTTLGGVLVYHGEGGDRRGADMVVALSEEFCRSIPVEGEERSEPGLLDREFVTPTSEAGGRPLYLYIVFAIVGGMILNIMPCVLPVIALKIFGLVKMAGDEPRKVKRMGWFFSFGILASFLVLALLVIVLQVAGQQVGWGFQFQEPLFVIAMCAVVFAFGLSLFGVYEIQLPGSAVASVGGLVAKQEGSGYAASFSEGVFATILATPCTAPFLGSALGFAFSQPWWVILLIFASVAFGMALPYLVLTLRPAWLRFVPKPGEWMVTAKQFMGFLMMGTLLWLLYVLGKQLGVEAVIWTGAFLLTVGISCWLVGRFATLSAGRVKSLATWAAAVAVGVLGYLFFLESILDVRSVIAGESSVVAGQATGDPDEILWEPFSLAKLEEYLDAENAVFLDFTAEWCLTCKVNERTVLADDTVVEKFRSTKIITVKADWTNRNPDITRLLAKFGRSGVPLYVVFPEGKPLEPIVLPEVITPGIVVDALDRAFEKSTGGML